MKDEKYDKVKEEILETYTDLVRFFIQMGKMHDKWAAQDEITEPVEVPFSR